MASNSFWTPNRLQRYVNEGLIRRRNQPPVARVANAPGPARLASGVPAREPITIEPAPSSNGVARLGFRRATNNRSRELQNVIRRLLSAPNDAQVASNNRVEANNNPSSTVPRNKNNNAPNDPRIVDGGRRRTRKAKRRASKKSRRVNRK